MNAPQEQPSCYRLAIREETVALRPELADLEFTADQPVAALRLDSVELIELIGALASRFSGGVWEVMGSKDAPLLTEIATAWLTLY